MLQWILILIKVVGIILGVLVAVILLLALLVLLVPVRYRIFGRAQKDIEFHVKASWLFHLLFFTACYENGVMALQFKALGITLKRNQEPDKRKESKKFNKQKRKKKVKKNKNENNSEENLSQENVSLWKSKERKEENRIEDNVVGSKIRKVKISKTESLIANIKSFFQRIFAFKEKILNTIKDMTIFFTDTKNKVSTVLAFLDDEGNRKGIQQTWLSIKKVLNHSSPKKIRGEILFGTGDPCSTGQALGILSLIYSFCGDALVITPDFENKVFRGELNGRGRIRLATLIIICIKLLYNDNFIQLRKNYKKLEEAI